MSCLLMPTDVNLGFFVQGAVAAQITPFRVHINAIFLSL